MLWSNGLLWLVASRSGRGKWNNSKAYHEYPAPLGKPVKTSSTMVWSKRLLGSQKMWGVANGRVVELIMNSQLLGKASETSSTMVWSNGVLWLVGVASRTSCTNYHESPAARESQLKPVLGRFLQLFHLLLTEFYKLIGWLWMVWYHGLPWLVHSCSGGVAYCICLHVRVWGGVARSFIVWIIFTLGIWSFIPEN